jgi:hypothetical protein
MSLDVYLKVRTGVTYRGYDEYEQQVVEVEVPQQTFEYNVTHNLNTMAAKAGLYEPLWRPEEIGIELASQLIDPLRKGLDVLKADPAFFKTFEPKNGWGSYDGLVKFVTEYLAACELNPHAHVIASR